MERELNLGRRSILVTRRETIVLMPLGRNERRAGPENRRQQLKDRRRLMVDRRQRTSVDSMGAGDRRRDPQDRRRTLFGPLL